LLNGLSRTFSRLCTICHKKTFIPLFQKTADSTTIPILMQAPAYIFYMTIIST
jgi:hypothetical protein